MQLFLQDGCELANNFISYIAFRLTSGSANNENVPEDDDTGNHSNSPPYSPGSQGRSRPAITHMVKRREGFPMPLPDASAGNWNKYYYIDDERKKKGDLVMSVFFLVFVLLYLRVRVDACVMVLTCSC